MRVGALVKGFPAAVMPIGSRMQALQDQELTGREWGKNQCLALSLFR
jgi:hypothetical protein